MRDVKIGRVGEAVLTIDLLHEEGASGAYPPVVRNVQLDRITSAASPRVLFIRGFAGAVIDGISIANSTFSGVSKTEVVQHAGTIIFTQRDRDSRPDRRQPQLRSGPEIRARSAPNSGNA